MNRKTGLLLFLCLLSIPLGADEPAPPPWIYGQWQTTIEGEGGEPNPLILVFLPRDILINGASIAEMIREGYILTFNQQISSGIYTIRLEYANGFWWEESFPMPMMTSVYIDETFEDGSYTTMTYKFLPLGMAPPPVPSDFE